MDSRARFDDIDSFTRIERVALGGTAEVWKACAPNGRFVALKWAHLEERFRGLGREVELLAHLPPTLGGRVHGFGCAEGRSWLAIDWIEGVDLTAVASRPMAPALAAYIVAELAELVAALHEQILPEIAPYGLLHGDLSPRNVRLTVDGRVRLMDFGSAVPLRADGHAAQCEPGGTLRYLAPEQLAGEPAQARSEVYALGLLLDELLIGGPAFDADDELELVMAVRSGQVRLPSLIEADVPFALEAICLQALSVDPSERPSSARAFAAELRAFLASLSERVRSGHVSALVRAHRGSESTRLPRPVPMEELATVHLYASADLHSADDVITANLHAWPVAAPVVPVVAPTSDHGDTLPEGLSCPWAAVRSSPAHETADELLRALRLATEGARAEVREPWLGRAALLLHGFAEAMTLTVGAAEELIDTASTRARRLGSATLVATLGAATFSFLTALPLALTWGAHALVTTSTLDDRMTLDSSVEAELPRFCAGPAIELASTGCRSSTRPTDVGGSR